MTTAKIVLIVSLTVCVLQLTTAQKPGSCPSSSHGIGICVEGCSGDYDCPGNQKCCRNGCGRTCDSPVGVKKDIARPAKPGTCPPATIRCFRSVCHSDYDCGGSKKCCSGNCLCADPRNFG